MRLDEFIETDLEDEQARKRQLAKEKSYQITEYIDELSGQFESLQDQTLVGSTAPEIFVGRRGYPDVSAGVLSPVEETTDPSDYATNSNWYGKDIRGILDRRTGLLQSRRQAQVNVRDVWDGFVGTQREVAIADRPVDIEIGLAETPDLDLSIDQVMTPTGPNATAESIDLRENPHVPRPVQKTLEDDDWHAEGAMTYLYRRGFDVYAINDILSAGALGTSEQRRLVPTRWSITAVDDTIGQFLRGQIKGATAVDQVEVYSEDYLGNRFWIVLAPGQWEFELVEAKAPGSVWNPTGTQYQLTADYEGSDGRSGYVSETAGAYYAARVGVLEALVDRGRQATALVLREVTADYWAPVGVWQVREAVRNAMDNEPAIAETFQQAVSQIGTKLSVSQQRLTRKSTLCAGRQVRLTTFE